MLAFFILMLSVQSLIAGSATWLSSPPNGNWNEASNWMPATIPNGPTDMATFGQSDTPLVSITRSSLIGQEEISGITFNPGASAFTITIFEEAGDGAFLLTISGAGIINSSGVTQNFVADSTFSGHGMFRFRNSSTAGNGTVFTNNGADVPTFGAAFPEGVVFIDSSTAGDATFVNHTGSVSGAVPGLITFDDNANAGHGTFTNNGATASGDIVGAHITFYGNASADHGSFVNNGGAVSPGGYDNSGTTVFLNNATAANATFTNNGGLADVTLGGGTFFANSSTAFNARFTNNGGEAAGASGGITGFLNSTSAGNGVFTSHGSLISGGHSGGVRFRNNSTASNGTFVNEPGLLINQGGGFVLFEESSTAGNGTFTNEGGTTSDAIGGVSYFRDSSTAANAILTANGGLNGSEGGGVQFEDEATGGTARLVLSGNGFLRISAHNAPGITIGSLEGSGRVFLGSNNLTIGTRNDDTSFSGVIQDSGSVTKIGSGTLTLSGTNTYAGPTTINAGALKVDGSIMGAVTVDSAGRLSGSGATGSVTVQSGGTVVPTSSQTLHVNGNYTQNAGGVLKIEVAGSGPNASSKLDVSGSATLGGTLEIRFLNGLLPISGQVIEVLHAGGAFTGSFAQVIFPDLRAGFQFQAEFANGTYKVTALNDGVAGTGFLNISTRMRVGTGDNALIGGFIVTGSASKKVILRAIGPSLAANGMPLPGRLDDPTLELRDSAGELLFSNDNWIESSQEQEIIDSTIPPSDDNEAAIVATLAPGSYTAIMRGGNNTTGIGAVEAYDLAQEVPAKLANISTRGFVETGDNVMIGGLIAGNQAMHVVVRALGPSLAQSGVPNALADPTLEMHDSQGAVIAFNDDWQEADQAAIEATGIPPIDDKEAAVLATLAPGNYTAIVRGQNNAIGVGLVEVYDLH